MDIHSIKNKMKTTLRNVIFFSPLKKIIPTSIRHRFSSSLMQKMNCSAYSSIPYDPALHPFGINLYGFFKAEIGLAQGVKLYAEALNRSSIPHSLLNTNFLPWLSQNDCTYDSQLSSNAPYSHNVIHINPDLWNNACGLFPKSYFDGHYNIGVFLWELETLPDSWLSVFDYIDEIWTPSEFIAKAIRQETTKPVTVIPYGITTPYDESLSRESFGFRTDDFLVLTMFDSNSYASRKNPGASIDAFIQAFGTHPATARLVIKVNNAKSEDIAFIHSKLGKNGPFYLITDRLDKEKLNALIHCCDVFISLHRSEGFGLVMAEAMALGVPVIATGWSSNTEFMPKDSTCLVDYTLIPVNGEYQYNIINQVWADANIDHAVEYLIQLYTDPVFRKKMAQKGKDYISSHFSLEQSAQKMQKRLEEIQSNYKL